MKRPKLRRAFLVALVFSAAVAVGCARDRQATYVIMTSTTVIESIVSEVGGSRAEVRSVVPGGMCPGHFDIKPRQMRAIESADLFLYHGWESWLPEVMNAAGKQTQVVQVGIEGNWMVPDIHIQAIDWVRQLLTDLDPASEQFYKGRASRYSSDALQATESLCDRLQPYQGTPVICSELQADFLKWAGFDIMATYGRSENLTPRALQDLIEIGRKHRVRLVVDNLQSGPEIGSQIAEDIGAGHVVLTNFPEHASYLEAIKKNARALCDALD